MIGRILELTFQTSSNPNMANDVRKRRFTTTYCCDGRFPTVAVIEA